MGQRTTSPRTNRAESSRRALFTVVSLSFVFLTVLAFLWNIRVSHTKKSADEAQVQEQLDQQAGDARDLPNTATGLQAYPRGEEQDGRPTSPQETSSQNHLMTENQIAATPDTPAMLDGVDASKGDYSMYDAELGRDIPIEKIGIPIPRAIATRALQLTTDDLMVLEGMETEVAHWAELGWISRDAKPGYRTVALDEDKKTVFVHPDFWEDFNRMLDLDEAIHEQSMVSVRDQEYYVRSSATKTLSDGTRIEYYRRRDGALIRSVTWLDGSQQKREIGWTDLSGYPEEYQKYWREE